MRDCFTVAIGRRPRSMICCKNQSINREILDWIKVPKFDKVQKIIFIAQLK